MRAEHDGVLLVVQIVVIPACCLLIASCPEAEVAKQGSHGDEEILGVPVADGAELRQLYAGIGREVVDEVVADVLQRGVLHGECLLCLLLGHDGLEHQRHLSVGLCELQVGPCAERLHGRILGAEQGASASLQSGVDMCQIVVAVVDDAIIVAHSIVLVGLREVEGGQSLQVGRGGIGDLSEVAAHFAEQDHTVGDELHLVDDAQHAVDGVGGVVEGVVFLELHEVRLSLEDVAAAGQRCCDEATR